MFLLEKMTLFVLERFAPRGMGGPRADLLYRNALLSNATNFSNEMNKETRIDLRFLAALVSMLARKPFLSNLQL